MESNQYSDEKEQNDEDVEEDCERENRSESVGSQEVSEQDVDSLTKEESLLRHKTCSLH